MTFTNSNNVELFTPAIVTMTTGEVHFWIYMGNTATESRIITTTQWGLRRSAAGAIEVFDASGSYAITGGTGLNDSAWHHVSIACDGDDLLVKIDGGSLSTLAPNTTQFTTPTHGVRFGNTTHLTGTYSGAACEDVWIDAVQIKSAGGNTAPPGSAVTGELVSENFEPMGLTTFPIMPGIVTIGTERIHYGAVDLTNNKLLFCTRGAEGTSAVAHLNSAVAIDCSSNLRVPAHRQIHLYGDNLSTAYNDPSTSLASGTGVSIETKFIRSASQGEYF